MRWEWSCRNDGFADSPGPLLLDQIFDAVDAAVREPVLGAAIAAGIDILSWLPPEQRLTFAPGLIDNYFRAINRPTFQQLLEFAPR